MSIVFNEGKMQLYTYFENVRFYSFYFCLYLHCLFFSLLSSLPKVSVSSSDTLSPAFK